jgi:hypothetical protein
MEIIGALFIIFILYIIVKLKGDSAEPTPAQREQIYFYSKKSRFMTPSEMEFYRELVDVAADKYHVFPQVRIASLINNDTKGKYWKASLSRINNKSVDYVLCDKETLVVAYAVELDDPTHLTEKRKRRDKMVNQIFKDVNLPLVRFSNYQTLTKNDIIQRFADAHMAA